MQLDSGYKGRTVGTVRHAVSKPKDVVVCWVQCSYKYSSIHMEYILLLSTNDSDCALLLSLLLLLLLLLSLLPLP